MLSVAADEVSDNRLDRRDRNSRYTNIPIANIDNKRTKTFPSSIYIPTSRDTTSRNDLGFSCIGSCVLARQVYFGGERSQRTRTSAGSNPASIAVSMRCTAERVRNERDNLQIKTSRDLCFNRSAVQQSLTVDAGKIASSHGNPCVVMPGVDPSPFERSAQKSATNPNANTTERKTAVN